MRYLILLISLFLVDLKANEDFIFNKSSNGVVVIFSETSIGSGAIITESGYVLTNHHVVEGYSELDVLIKNADSYEEAEHRAIVIKTDKYKDLALLKIVNPKARLFPIKISRVIPKNLCAEINLNNIKPLKIFNWLKKNKISDREMLKTFNCGVGFCIIIKKKNLNKIKKIFKKEFKPYIIGKIISGKNKIKLNEKIKW